MPDFPSRKSRPKRDLARGAIIRARRTSSKPLSCIYSVRRPRISATWPRSAGSGILPTLANR